MQDLVSIIIPAYNAEHTLKHCVDSLLQQTYEPLEIVIVDDGSKDKTGAIGESYAKKYEHILLIGQNNAGVSAARNSGLQVASGQWISFCDSDDYLEKDFIEQMVKNQKKFKSDWVISGYKRKTKNGSFIFDTPYSKNKIPQSKLEEFVAEWYKNSYVAGPCWKLYSSTLIHKNQIYFPPKIQFGEDTIFNIRYIKTCKCISILKSSGYVYVNQEGSLTKSFEFDIWGCQLAIFDEFQKLCHEKEYGDKVWLRFFVRGITLSLNIAAERQVNKKFWRGLCQRIQGHPSFSRVNDKDIQLDYFARIVCKQLDLNHLNRLWWLFRIKILAARYMGRLYYCIKR